VDNLEFRSGLAEISAILPLGRSYFLISPGTPCVATIVLSLRDKNHPPIEAPRAYGWPLQGGRGDRPLPTDVSPCRQSQGKWCDAARSLMDYAAER
jgi:hypothetical protein